MRTHSRYMLHIVVAIATLTVATSVALSQQTAERVITKLSTKDLTLGLTKAIAEVAPSVKIPIAAGASLREVVTKHCGRDDTHFLEMLRDKSTLVGIPPEQITADYIFPVQRSLELPYCLQLPDPVSKSNKFISPAELAYVYSKAFQGRDYPAPVANFQFPTVPSQAAGYAVSYFDTLFEPKVVAFPLRTGLKPEVAFARLNPEVPKRAEFSSDQQGIQHITVLTSSEDKCLQLLSDKLPEKYPVDVYEVLRVLGLNASIRPRSREFPIFIGDSGIHEPNSNLFRANFAEDDEQNKPNSDYLHHQHGTYVASAALGGPYFMRFWPRLGNPLKITARNIISKVKCQAVTQGEIAYQDRCPVDAEALRNIVSAGTGGGIVNLSVARPGEIDVVTRELQYNRDHYLIVVAAGNSGKRIADESYPAMLVRKDEFGKYMLVVGALESSGKYLAKNSSYHSEVVEIAAYGCKIPVYEYLRGSAPARYKLVHQSGTSMAAALVSFTAALVAQQMDLSPVLVKRRLLISADYEPHLEFNDVNEDGRTRTPKVKNNARLNISRALSLFHDVVDLKDGRRIYGKLNDGDEFYLDLCGGRNAMRRSQLRSLSIFADEGKRMVFFYHGDRGAQSEPGAALYFAKCVLNEPNPNNRNSDLTASQFVMEDVESAANVTFVLGDVTNMTLAHRPYWLK